MKRLTNLWCALAVAVSVSANTPPPPLPWFSSAVTQFLDDGSVFVLGWSKDGKAAVLYPQDGGGRGGPGLNFAVLDTVEDTVLFATDLWPDEFDEMGESSPILADAMWYSDKAQAFIEAMANAGVEPSRPRALEMRDFPFRRNAAEFTAMAVVQPIGEPDEFGSRAFDWRLVVRSAQGEKTIAKGREEQAYDVSVFGYVASPWEQRILVVYGVSHPGFEGERPLTYAFSGCLLTKGFLQK